MARFKVYIEYDGTRYSGWQIQKNAKTVQGEIVACLRDLFQTGELEFTGSGRTDAGVHALTQVAHLDVKTMLAPEVIRKKLNDELPADINILEIEKAPSRFHARHDAVARSYVYQISRRRTAFGKRFVWWIRDPLDFPIMRTASSLFTGMKNFRSFTDDDPEETSTTVHIEEMTLKEDHDLILIRIVGSHFIWKLVRRIVGVLVEVGRGKLSREDVRRYLNTSSEEPARLTAPPSGLFLERVYYKGDARMKELHSLIPVHSHAAHRRYRGAAS